MFELRGRALCPVDPSASEITVQTVGNAIGSGEAAGSPTPVAGAAGGPGPAARTTTTTTTTTTADIRRTAELAAAAVHAAGGGTANDNRDLVDDNTAQALGQEDVQRMKDAGASAAEIVSSLVANSATYQGKTEYAKAKYIKKKQRQYAPTFRALPACAQTIVDTMHHKDPKRICGLRSDSVAQLLAYGNVRASCTVLVVDGAKGLLVGAAAERMAGDGRIVNLALGPHPSVPMLSHFNLGESAGTLGPVGHFPFSMIPLLAASHGEQGWGRSASVLQETSATAFLLMPTLRTRIGSKIDIS